MPKFFQQVTILVLAVLATNGIWQFAVADVEPKTTRQQWEWKSLNKTNAKNLEPTEGWELVAVSEGVLYFKRPK